MGVDTSDSLIKSTFSPDGKYVLSGSESGQLCCWSTKSGTKKGEKLWAVQYNKPLLGVAWSQNEHLIALCAYGEDCPILFYAAEHSSSLDNDTTNIPDGETVSESLRKDDDSLYDSRRLEDNSSIASSTDRTPMRPNRRGRDFRSPLSAIRGTDYGSEDGGDDELGRSLSSTSAKRRQRKKEKHVPSDDESDATSAFHRKRDDDSSDAE